MPDREPFGAATVTPPAQRRMGPLAERAGEEHAAALRERRSRRLRKVTGTLLVAAAFVAVLISLSKRSQPTATERVIDAQVRSALSGVPQSGTRLGVAAAPVTVTYFGDLECPVCSQLTLGGGFPQLLARDVREGRVKVVYRSLCTATCNGPGEQVFDTQQVAAYAAGRAGPLLELRGALLPRARSGGQRLRHRRLSGPHRSSGPGPRHERLGRRPPRSGAAGAGARRRRRRGATRSRRHANADRDRPARPAHPLRHRRATGTSSRRSGRSLRLALPHRLRLALPHSLARPTRERAFKRSDCRRSQRSRLQSRPDASSCTLRLGRYSRLWPRPGDRSHSAPARHPLLHEAMASRKEQKDQPAPSASPPSSRRPQRPPADRRMHDARRGARPRRGRRRRGDRDLQQRRQQRRAKPHRLKELARPRSQIDKQVEHAASRDPAIGHDARQPEGAGDDHLLRRPRVPGLRRTSRSGSRRRLPATGLQRGQERKGQGRRTDRSVLRPATTTARACSTPQQVAAYAAGMQNLLLELRRDLLPGAGPGGQAAT